MARIGADLEFHRFQSAGRGLILPFQGNVKTSTRHAQFGQRPGDPFAQLPRRRRAPLAQAVGLLLVDGPRRFHGLLEFVQPGLAVFEAVQFGFEPRPQRRQFLGRGSMLARQLQGGGQPLFDSSQMLGVEIEIAHVAAQFAAGFLNLNQRGVE